MNQKINRFSDNHSFLVANVLHLQTGYISLQYQIVLGDIFKPFLDQERIMLLLPQFVMVYGIIVAIGMPILKMRMVSWYINHRP